MMNKKASLRTLLIFVILSIALTYPLIFKMKGSVYGLPGDTLGTIWKFWWLKSSIWSEHISPWFCPYLAAPFGLDLSIIPQNAFYTYLVPLFLFFFDEIFTYNLILLFSFILSALTMYLLAYYFTENKPASIASGILYAFCPYHFAQAYEHLSLANIQWLPPYALFLFKLSEKRSYRYVLLSGLAFALIILFDYTYGYFAAVLTLTFVLWRIWYGLRNKRLSSNYSSLLKTVGVVLVAVLVAMILVLPFTYHTFWKNILITQREEAVTELGYVRPFGDLFTYAAKPFDYLLPSLDNPIFGKYMKGYINVSHPTEHTLYLGWVGIILSIVAIREWRRQNKEQRLQATGCRPQAIQLSSNPRKIPSESRGRQAIKYPVSGIKDQGSRIQKAVSFFLFAGLVALIFSFPPLLDFGPLRILFPPYFMYKLLPMFRVSTRFGILVMLSVSVLSGIGLAHLVRKNKTLKRQVGLFVVVFLLVLIEFVPTLPAPMIDAVNLPPVYEWLAHQEGEFIIAEYPLENDSGYLFWQRVHKKRLVNGALPNTISNKIRKKIIDVSGPDTPAILKHLGVKYLVFHPEKYAASDEIAVIGEVPDLGQQNGLELIQTFEQVQVYQIK